ncbi:MAG TPA: hypothetical protein VK869_04990 [Rubrobacteraceae bacterium]|nr:hypothetical protein [Rubrobacteraceae bacterium]
MRPNLLPEEEVYDALEEASPIFAVGSITSLSVLVLVLIRVLVLVLVLIRGRPLARRGGRCRGCGIIGSCRCRRSCCSGVAIGRRRCRCRCIVGG